MLSFDWKDFNIVNSRYWERRHGSEKDNGIEGDAVSNAYTLVESSDDECALMDALIDLLIQSNADEKVAQETLWHATISGDVNSLKMRVSAYIASLRGATDR